jgi:hypothetical protein
MLAIIASLLLGICIGLGIAAMIIYAKIGDINDPEKERTIAELDEQEWD